MSETRFHGARVTENTDLVTAINDVDSSVIGIVATADDADAKLFPLNKPTLLTRVNDVLGKCGTTGTLYRALKAIADQVSTKVIVVRVAEHKEEDEKTQDQLVIGGSEDDGSYTGMYALLVAEQDESIGYRPRILAAPELDTEAVTKSLCVIAGKLRAFVYASCHGCNTMAEAITYRQKFNEREVMLLWPDFIAYSHFISEGFAMRVQRGVYRTPCAVWTARERALLLRARERGESVIFEIGQGEDPIRLDDLRP